jgi:6,7-dimethyl-8-ribityllumazine synthase
MLEIQGRKNADGHRYAIVASRFNPEIVTGLISGAMFALSEAGVEVSQVPVFRVPGAFEIPLATQRLAESGKYDAVIAIGCLIQGETPHFEYISNQVSLGIGRVALDYGIPVTFGVITVLTDEQAVARSGKNSENKGYEAAAAAVEMVNLLREM